MIAWLLHSKSDRMEAVEINIIPIKCALKFSPPLLILVYRDDSTGILARKIASHYNKYN